MKYFVLYTFCGFFSTMLLGQHAQIEKTKSLYKNDSIIQFEVVTTHYDTVWVPGDANKIIDEVSWYRGDSIDFVKFHPLISGNDTSFLSLDEVIALQFENLRYYTSEPVSTFETYSDIRRVSFTFNSSENVISELIRLESKQSDQPLLYSDHIVEYEYSGSYIQRKKYFDKVSDTVLKLIKIVEFYYIR